MLTSSWLLIISANLTFWLMNCIFLSLVCGGSGENLGVSMDYEGRILGSKKVVVEIL